MPVVKIEIWEGRTEEKKEEVIQKVTKVISETLDIPERGVHIIINETPRQNWGIGGTQASKMNFEKK
ncbi:2-hydroxymuconate tautomerase family protein [Candidatus Woesearchaeota archaeon]|nr:2-hydroxymuconate tautomerase family protein [Candidatus Woesearchaeota archaeon]